ncbi:MAG: preprotein translocase subunit YajC [Treponema sp.]|jgi:preprotein translocase subunit YajC|nr:preprotein translocase subunit YajC [Treponema sp.]
MNTFVLPLLMGMGGAQSSGAEGGVGGLMSFLPFVLIIGIFYFLLIRPQSKKRKETEQMLRALKKGDKVVTIGGLNGIIQSVKETTVIIKADDNVKLEFLRSAISSVVTVSKEKEGKIEDKSEENAEEEKSEAGE